MILQTIFVLVATLATSAGSAFVSAGVLHDEELDGDMPRTLSLVPTELMNQFTFDAMTGSNIVRGSSDFSGAQNVFLLDLAGSQLLRSIDFKWQNPIDRNSLFFFVWDARVLDRGDGTSVLFTDNIRRFDYPLDMVGLISSSIDTSDAGIANGLHAIFFNAAVGGTREPYVFDIDFRVSSVPEPGTLSLVAFALFLLRACRFGLAAAAAE